MTLFHDDGQVALYQGDVRAVLRGMAPESVNCVVTSPPYWSLRDYGVPPSVWPSPESRVPSSECEHEWGDAVAGGESYTGSTRWQHTTNGRGEEQPDEKRLRSATTRELRPEAWGKTKQGQFCQLCGAWLGALGLEPAPELFVAHMVEVFREVRRVLRPDGTLWLNIGDSYSSGGRGYYDDAPGANKGNHVNRLRPIEPYGLKNKDMVGIPWMLAFALRADGWWLRQDIIWSKPNPMPESTRDRCTKAHEYLFLLTKSERYWSDFGAIREASSYPEGPGNLEPCPSPPGERTGENANIRGSLHEIGPRETRNKRSVWHIPVAPFPEAHFATFPPALVEPCVLAGCPAGGVVLDPFVGSGTTAMVARRLGRRAVGIDLNPEYLAMAVRRIGSQQFLVPAETSVAGVS